ncbi:MAG: hypothetical protein R2734_14060 [Nocardioides sp.]
MSEPPTLWVEQPGGRSGPLSRCAWSRSAPTAPASARRSSSRPPGPLAPIGVVLRRPRHPPSAPTFQRAAHLILFADPAEVR